MPRVNRTRFAILGMLMSGPKSGYDLKRDFEEQISHFWSESLGQIYPALHRLHEEGLVSVRTQRGRGRPERKVYRLTKPGEDAFRAWLSQPAAASGVRNELLLKVFFGPEMNPAQVLDHIDRFEASQRDLRALYPLFEKEIEQRPGSLERKLYWRLAVASGRHVNRARLAWCREARAAVEAFAGEIAHEPGATR
jgi:DNA-binding PadR family transcriptional regulator